MNRWTPYKCPHCSQAAAVPGWQMGLVAGASCGLGWFTIQRLGFWGWWSFLLYLIIAAAVMTWATMLFCKFTATLKETPPT